MLLLPLTLSTQIQLKVLDLSHNQMTNVNTPKFHNLQSLKFLLLSHNKMTSLPSELCLSTMVVLNLSFNDLDHGSLPESCDLVALTRLHSLDLSNNKFGEIPPQLCCLTSLKELQMQNNRLTYVREELPLHNMKELVVLDLSHNMLRKFGPRAARYT